MQKFTRAITREVELGGERLALTLDETGVTIRPVGSRKPPLACSWASLLGHLARQGEEPTADEVTAALGKLRSEKSASRPPKSEAASKGEPVLLSRILGSLETWLKEHRERYYRNLRPAATAAELDALEKAVGMTLPDDLRMLLSWHNGQGDDFAGALEGSWLLMGTTQIATAKSDLDAAVKEDPATGWDPQWLPFLDDDSGNYVCTDTSEATGPVREFWLGNAEHPVVAPSIQAWFATFVAAVERGEYVEDPERGRFLKRPG